MVKLNKSITITGASVINVEGNEVQVAFMNATIPPDGKVNYARAIQNKELFDANREEVLKDFAAFDEYVYSIEPESQEDETQTEKS